MREMDQKGSGQAVTEEELRWIRKRDRMRLGREGQGGSAGDDKWRQEGHIVKLGSAGHLCTLFDVIFNHDKGLPWWLR